MFITIYFYDTQTRECIVSEPDTAHTIVTSLDKNDSIRQWCCSDEAYSFPWYKDTLWDKLIYSQGNWNYKQ